MSGVIYMVPVTLGNPDHSLTVPAGTRDITLSLRLFAVEDIRSARRYLRSLSRDFPIDETDFFEVGKHSDPSLLTVFFSRVAGGADAGVMSEAGMPGLADPGNIVVAEAHRRKLRVIPLTGPSSVILALVASGLNGQSFAFHGYLPVDSTGRLKAIRELERRSLSGETQIFMEAPFRNDAMKDDIIAVCKPSTRLCIAADITLSSEKIETKTIASWSKEELHLGKKPVIFLIQA